MFSLKKLDDLRAREREREEKGTTNSAPVQYHIMFIKDDQFSKGSTLD